MESRNNILKELQELSPALASSYPLPVPYKVPDGYFGQLPETILAMVKEPDNAAEELETLSPLLRRISKTPPFHLPEGYFKDLTENTLAETKAVAFVQEELEDFSPLLSQLKDAPLYQVPAGYFDQLPATIMQKLQAQQPAKVVKMGSRMNLRRYIAAAAVLLVLATGAWWFFQPATPGTETAGIDKTKVQNLPDEELISFLNEQSLASLESSEALASNLDAESDGMQDLLKDVSDEELQQYVDRNGAPFKTISN
ncbi:MAG: hypothetical protein ACTHMC_06620 [Pseudobacter sp.]|uniref:hypothetical protein n=1 Tax=Pseudobacter sp. TaxID=2045420 RepID=UPI003F7DD9B2